MSAYLRRFSLLTRVQVASFYRTSPQFPSLRPLSRLSGYTNCSHSALPLGVRALSTSPPTSDNNFTSDHALSTYDTIASSASHYLQTFHDTLSLDALPISWSVTIPLAAVSLRLVTMPLIYYSHLHASRAAFASRELPRIHHFVRNVPGTLVQKYITFRRLRALTLRAAGTSPISQFPWHIVAHIPLFISASMGIRELASNAPQQWHSSGLFFCPDLAAADPTSILPITTTALWLWNINPDNVARRRAAQAMATHHTERSRLVDTLVNKVGETFSVCLQMLSVLSLMYTTYLPSGVILFWMSNAVLTAAQRFAFSQDSFRRMVGLPTYADIRDAPDAQLMPAVGRGMEAVRKELSYIQQRMLAMFPNRTADERLCADINRMLERERWNGRVWSDLRAELRRDERDGRRYVAVVPKSS